LRAKLHHQIRAARTGTRREMSLREKSWPRRLTLALLLGLTLSTGGQAALIPAVKAAPGALLEDLQYKADIWLWKDAARGRLTLKSLGSGRYQAEIFGQAQGALGVLSGQRRDSYRTEMVLSQGKLLPVVYQEESRRRGKHSLKEYRFDYAKGRIELWQWKENQKVMVRKWQAPLKEPMYDPLSAFYNLRLGALGPLKEGDTIRVTGIPYPKPDEIEVRIGPATPEGRQAMVSFFNASFENKRAFIHVLTDDNGVPTQAWTTVLSFGKIAGQLLPAGKSLQGGLPELLSGSEPSTGDREVGVDGGNLPGLSRPVAFSP
jgi:hypothetical protein